LSSTSNNGKTYASFFDGYPKSKLAQLYFHRELPTSEVCTAFYRISDESTLLHALGRTRQLGTRVDSMTVSEQFLGPTTTRALASSRAVRLVRNAVLKPILARGIPSVDPWLREFGPDLIFFCGGDATYLYPLVEKIADDFDTPIVFYITDDYVLPSPSDGPLARLSKSIVRSNLVRLCARSALTLTIGQKMTDVYSARLGINSRPLMNLVSVPEARLSVVARAPTDRVVLCYAGGLHLQRWKVLAQIGASLDRNAARGVCGELHIYTATPLSRRMSRELSRHTSITLHESASPSVLATIYEGADLLVHVESFRVRDRASTFLSVSTKIPEYLAAGRSILAVGPPEVASIEYLAKTGSAFVCGSLEDVALDRVVSAAISDKDARERRADVGRAVAARNHGAARARRRLWRDFIEVTRTNRVPRSSTLDTTG